MSKFKYNDKVLIIKDPENDGFFEGIEGVVLTREFFDKTNIKYGVDVGHYRGVIYCKEDDIQNI